MELIGRLRRDLSSRLQAQGWTVRDDDAHDIVETDADELETCTRPLRDGFSVVAMFAWAREDASDQIAVVGGLGIEYKPARALLEHLVGSEVFCVLFYEPTVAVRVGGATSVSTAVEALVGFISDQAPQMEGLADVDRIIELIRGGRVLPFAAHMAGFYALDALNPESGRSVFVDRVYNELELIIALLTGAGRYEEARQALTENTQDFRDGDVPYDHRRFIRQITRVIDARGQLALPQTPPRWPPRTSGPKTQPDPLQLLRETSAERKGSREAIDAVRAVSAGRNRDELRALLARELSGRGVSIARDSVQPTIDLIATERERFGKVRIAAQAAKAAVDLVGSWRERPHASRPRPGMGDREPRQPTSGPEFDASLFARPDRAAYPLGYHLSFRRAAIEVGPRAYAFLERLADRQTIAVWLTWSTESRAPGARLDVHAGTERVGRLDAHVADCFRSAMEAAAERDEDPWTYAQLRATFGAAPYILTVGLPDTSGSNTS